jgi:4-aminobutyrate aminotransferase
MTDLVSRDAEAFFHQDGSSPCLSALRAVNGIWLEEADGHRLVDLHGNTAHHLGYGHPVLIAALKAQLDDLPFSPRRFTNEPAVGLAEKLLSLWPGAPAKVLFATGGSDAIEIAVKLARVATGRHETISLENSYHGHGFGAFGLSRANPDPRLGPFLPGRYHVSPYWGPGGAEKMVADIRQAFAQSERGIAAVIAEPIRSNCQVPPDWLWPEVRRLCNLHGAQLIFDEIPSGLGKTGKFFAFEHVGAIPDAVVLGKALGGGSLPIAAVIADARLNVAPDLNLGHYTHEKNPLTTRAALTTIEIIERDGLAAAAAAHGAHVARRIGEISERTALIKGVRGKGLLLAIELEPSLCRISLRGGFAERFLELLRSHGISTVFKDSSSIGFSPPLTISTQEIDDALACIEQAAQAAMRMD